MIYGPLKEGKNTKVTMENDAWLHSLQSTNFAHANLFCLQTFQQPLKLGFMSQSPLYH